MRIAVLAGGVGGARFLLGVKAHLGWPATGPAPDDTADQVTAIVNTADDIRLHNLQICPDLDSCMYTLSGASDTERGWGRAGETWTVSGELAGYGAEAPWFSLGDKDIATHLVRTRMLDAGYPLSAVTAALCDRWQPGVTLLPMTDDRVETHVVVRDPEAPDPLDAGLVALHFQEWWIRYRAALAARRRSRRSVRRSPGRRRAWWTRSWTPTWSWSPRPTRWSRSARCWRYRASRMRCGRHRRRWWGCRR